MKPKTDYAALADEFARARANVRNMLVSLARALTSSGSPIIPKADLDETARRIADTMRKRVR